MLQISNIIGIHNAETAEMQIFAGYILSDIFLNKEMTGNERITAAIIR